jgi:2-methylcitrate dehydratase
LRAAQNLQNLKKGELNKLNIQIKKNQIKKNLKKGIF